MHKARSQMIPCLRCSKFGLICVTHRPISQFPQCTCPYPTMHGNRHISVMKGALLDMGEVLCRICNFGLNTSHIQTLLKIDIQQNGIRGWAMCMFRLRRVPCDLSVTVVYFVSEKNMCHSIQWELLWCEFFTRCNVPWAVFENWTFPGYIPNVTQEIFKGKSPPLNPWWLHTTWS